MFYDVVLRASGSGTVLIERGADDLGSGSTTVEVAVRYLSTSVMQFLSRMIDRHV